MKEIQIASAHQAVDTHLTLYLETSRSLGLGRNLGYLPQHCNETILLFIVLVITETQQMVYVGHVHVRESLILSELIHPFSTDFRFSEEGLRMDLATFRVGKKVRTRPTVSYGICLAGVRIMNPN